MLKTLGAAKTFIIQDKLNKIIEKKNSRVIVKLGKCKTCFLILLMFICLPEMPYSVRKTGPGLFFLLPSSDALPRC